MWCNVEVLIHMCVCVCSKVGWFCFAGSTGGKEGILGYLLYSVWWPDSSLTFNSTRRLFAEGQMPGQGHSSKVWW